MKIIILAAGMGERLWPLTKDIPKPLLEVREGVSLLEEQLSRISQSGVIDSVVIVTGYLGHKVDEMVSGLNIDNLDISTVYNPFYRVSNNLASLWIARAEIDQDTMITNGDNLFHSDVFKDFSEECGADGVYLSLGKKDHFDDDDMRSRSIMIWSFMSPKIYQSRVGMQNLQGSVLLEVSRHGES